jgi:hypothetical protein
MNRILLCLLNFDFFKQGIQWRVDTKYERLGSGLGLIMTAMVAIVSLYYLILRYDVMINHLDS